MGKNFGDRRRVGGQSFQDRGDFWGVGSVLKKYPALGIIGGRKSYRAWRGSGVLRNI